MTVSMYMYNYFNRELRQIGLKYGASVVLCHLKEESNGEFTLNTANTGLGEAILCSGNQVTVLTNPHNPATNKEESNRVAQEKGFISEVSFDWLFKFADKVIIYAILEEVLQFHEESVY